MLEALSPHSSMNATLSRPTSRGLDEQKTSSASETSLDTHPNEFTEKISDNSTGPQQDSVQLNVEALEIAKLADRDREVRAHETAHAAVGGNMLDLHR